MAIPPRGWVGYALLTAGSLLLFDTYTFLRTNWSPLRVPMYASDEIALGYMFALFGIAVLIAPRFLRTLEDFAPDSSVTMASGTADHSIEWRRQQRLPLRKKFSTSPNRGLIGGAAMLLLLVPTFLLVTQEYPQQGIYVHLTLRHDGGPDENCLAGPIVVTVRGDYKTSQLFVDGVKVDRAELPQTLKNRLKSRANWEVFIEGDEDLSFSDVADAISVVRDLGANSVILTPKLRKQFATQCRLP